MRRLWWSWVRWVTFGECAGFAIPAVAGAVARDAPLELLLTLILAAGAAEGAVLGWSQSRVLRRVIGGFSGVQWIGRTSVAAMVAWLIGVIGVIGVLGGVLMAAAMAAVTGAGLVRLLRTTRVDAPALR